MSVSAVSCTAFLVPANTQQALPPGVCSHSFCETCGFPSTNFDTNSLQTCSSPRRTCLSSSDFTRSPASLESIPNLFQHFLFPQRIMFHPQCRPLQPSMLGRFQFPLAMLTTLSFTKPLQYLSQNASTMALLLLHLTMHLTMHLLWQFSIVLHVSSCA